MYNVEGVSSVSGPTLPADIWHLYMDRAGAHFPPTEFPEPKEPADLEKFYSKFTGRAEIPVAPTLPQPTVEAEIETEPVDTGGGGETPPDPGVTDPAPPPPPPPSAPVDTAAPPASG
jgi:hypothetical protein